MSRYRVPGALGLRPAMFRFETGTATPWRPAQPPGVAHGEGPSSDWLLLASADTSTVLQPRDLTAAEGERIVGEAAQWTARRAGHTATGEYFNRPFTLMAIQHWGKPVIASRRPPASNAHAARSDERGPIPDSAS